MSSDSIIAAKYKEYNKVRDVLSGKVIEPVLPPPKHQTPKKRKREENNGGLEASKRQQIDKTPSKTQIYPWDVDPYDSPSAIRNLFSPSKKALGPTPQRDGHVLGLFDLLEEVAQSPSNPNGKTIHGTPGKSRAAGTPHKDSRTPGGRKKLFDAFATPSRNRNAVGQDALAPTSVSKSDLTTPSFLRRINVFPPDGVWKSPELARGPRKPVMRSLSSMLASLRQMQDDAADDDLDALHEMENMDEVGRDIPKAKVTKTRPLPETIPEEPPKDILVEDSQPGFPLGGFDDEAQFDSDPEAPELGRDGKPLKAYKKKGQKRTTRRVKMKPNRSKPAAEPKHHLDDEGSEDELAGDDSAVPETQINPETGFAATRNYDSESQSEYTASEGGTRYRRADQTKNRNLNKDGKIKSAARKVGALAHTNFKRLKLRNSGAKGGAAHNSRFRRKK